MFHCEGVWILSVSHLCRYFWNVTSGSAATVTALARREVQRTSARIAGLAVQRQFA
jgi:hypothetical protein